ncbi:MAG: hypothetical protein LJE62_14650 [Silicimonas sp.]|jgi:hypothetical protein|nr:hypothetical protein [Silicimonas sp.]
MRLFTWVLLVASAVIWATTMVHGDTLHDEVLSCFDEVDTTTNWNTCLGTMFAPCAKVEVGSDDHIACLKQQRESWFAAKTGAEEKVVSRLSEDGMAELSGLMLAWPKFVEDKCNAVAESRASISFEAAALGCQISELALMTNEMSACLEGRSTEAYCQLRDE